MPGRNAAKWVGDALTSLTRQFDDPDTMEIVFVDDGSEDATVAIVESYAERFSDLRIIRNETGHGVSHARNRGLAATRGRYIAFLDTDDWFAPGNLQSLLNDIERIGCDFLRTDIIQAWGTKRHLKRAPQTVRGVALDPRDGVLPIDRITMVDHAWTQAGMYDRRLVDEGLMHFPEDLLVAEDRPWVWNLHLKARSYAVVDCPGFVYRLGVPTSLTRAVDFKRLDYLPAHDAIRAMVADDRDAERFMPKVIQATFGLTEHHMKSYDKMAPEIQRQMLKLTRELMRSFPADHLAAVVAGLSAERRAAMAWTLDGSAPPGSAR